MHDRELAERVADLERRVAALESSPGDGSADAGGRTDGVLTYHGELEQPYELRWDIAVPAGRVLRLPGGPGIEVLAALAHPARAAIVRALAGDGARTGAELQESAELGSTGQFYHHLKPLTAAGIVEQDKRGSYRLRPTATIPALVLLTAAADIAGQLR